MTIVRANLEAERARHGLTKTELTQRIGISLNTYGEYVKGAPMPSTKLCMLADMFKVSTDYLLDRTPLTIPTQTIPQNTENNVLHQNPT